MDIYSKFDVIVSKIFYDVCLGRDKIPDIRGWHAVWCAFILCRTWLLRRLTTTWTSQWRRLWNIAHSTLKESWSATKWKRWRQLWTGLSKLKWDFENRHVYMHLATQKKTWRLPTEMCIHYLSLHVLGVNICFFFIIIISSGASVGGGRRALKHRGHCLAVGHPPGSSAQPCRYRCSATLTSASPTPLLSWTVSSLPTLPSSPVPGRKRACETPGCLLPVAGCKGTRCLLSCSPCWRLCSSVVWISVLDGGAVLWTSLLSLLHYILFLSGTLHLFLLDVRSKPWIVIFQADPMKLLLDCGMWGILRPGWHL